MPEPVDPAADLVLTRGIGGDVAYRAWQPDDTFAAAVTCYGFSTQPRVVRDGNGVWATTALWTLTGLDSEPQTQSRIVDADGAPWRIDRVTGARGVWDCETTLTPDP